MFEVCRQRLQVVFVCLLAGALPAGNSGKAGRGVFGTVARKGRRYRGLVTPALFCISCLGTHLPFSAGSSESCLVKVVCVLFSSSLSYVPGSILNLKLSSCPPF